jgi:uncharacterized protein YecE (DUF72 family)
MHRRRAKGLRPRERVSGYTADVMGTVYAGTSGWAYTSWKPNFYPRTLGTAKFLSYYASRLNSVEVNCTFRSEPTEKLLRGWIEATPAQFQFAIKAHQSITHIKRLRGAAGLASEFIAALEPLREAKKLGSVLFQLPPFLKCDVALLKDFLSGLSRQTRCAFEFRHESWFNEEVFEALRKANAALCLAESEKLVTPDAATADFCYLRLRKEKYSAKARKEIKKRVVKLSRKGDVFAYFKHEETPEGALYAENLLNVAGERSRGRANR